MQLKEYLVKKLSLKLKVPERIIDSVITNQFQSAFQATSHYNTIELSGFGKFIFSQDKGLKQMEKYKAQVLLYNSIISDPNSSAILIRNNQMRLATTIKNIEHLKPKLQTNE